VRRPENHPWTRARGRSGSYVRRRGARLRAGSRSQAVDAQRRRLLRRAQSSRRRPRSRAIGCGCPSGFRRHDDCRSALFPRPASFAARQSFRLTFTSRKRSRGQNDRSRHPTNRPVNPRRSGPRLAGALARPAPSAPTPMRRCSPFFAREPMRAKRIGCQCPGNRLAVRCGYGRKEAGDRAGRRPRIATLPFPPLGSTSAVSLSERMTQRDGLHRLRVRRRGRASGRAVRHGNGRDEARQRVGGGAPLAASIGDVGRSDVLQVPLDGHPPSSAGFL
jgi:hypothetical protein